MFQNQILLHFDSNVMYILIDSRKVLLAFGFLVLDLSLQFSTCLEFFIVNVSDAALYDATGLINCIEML